MRAEPADAGTRARGDVAPCTVALAQPGAGVLSSEAELRTQISQRVSVCVSRQQKLRMFTSLPTSHSTVTVTVSDEVNERDGRGREGPGSRPIPIIVNIAIRASEAITVTVQYSITTQRDFTA